MTLSRMLIIVITLLALPSLAAELPRTASPPGAEAYFISPQDGEILRGPVTVRFGLRGMGIAPAGIAMKGTGHHHLIINARTPSPGQPVPADERHLHFGLGQTETTLTLPPGRHRLQLVLADHLHIPHEPPVVSTVISITVLED